MQEVLRGCETREPSTIAKVEAAISRVPAKVLHPPLNKRGGRGRAAFREGLEVGKVNSKVSLTCASTDSERER